MGRNLKFNEESKILTVRVPKNKYIEIRNKLNNILNNKNNINIFLNNNTTTDSQILKKIFQNNINIDLITNQLTIAEMQRILEILNEIKEQNEIIDIYF